MSKIPESTLPAAPFLGKRKDSETSRPLCAGQSKPGPKVTKEGEAAITDDGNELSFVDYMEKVSQQFYQALVNGELDEEGDDKVKEEEDDEPCEICKGKGHWPLCCPWKEEIPPCSGIPAGIPSPYEVACKYCWAVKFDEETDDCARCGYRIKKVLLKTCSLCWRRGHKDNTHEECPLYGKTVIPENYPFNKTGEEDTDQ